MSTVAMLGYLWRAARDCGIPPVASAYLKCQNAKDFLSVRWGNSDSSVGALEV
jgi:hypothetical protein